MREFQITPDVNVYFERSEADANFFHLVFKNTGLGYAKNVKFSLLKNFNIYDDNVWDVKNNELIKNGIETFYSQQTIKFYFTDLSQRFEEKLSNSLKLGITYFDLNNKKYYKETTLTLLEISGTGVITPPDTYIGRIPYELEEIKKILKEKFKNQK